MLSYVCLRKALEQLQFHFFKDFNICKCFRVDVIFFMICFSDTQIALDRKLAHASKDLRQVRLLTIFLPFMTIGLDEQIL